MCLDQVPVPAKKCVSHHISSGNAYGLSIIPLSLVFVKYRLILSIVCLCVVLGSDANWVHLMLAYARSGLLDFHWKLSWSQSLGYSHGMSCVRLSSSRCSILFEIWHVFGHSPLINAHYLQKLGQFEASVSLFLDFDSQLVIHAPLSVTSNVYDSLDTAISNSLLLFAAMIQFLAPFFASMIQSAV